MRMRVLVKNRAFVNMKRSVVAKAGCRMQDGSRHGTGAIRFGMRRSGSVAFNIPGIFKERPGKFFYFRYRK
jgi:hypothetical protein